MTSFQVMNLVGGQAFDPTVLDGLKDSDLRAMLDEALAFAHTLQSRLGYIQANGRPIHPIAQMRKKLGLTQCELAKLAGISAPAMHRIEHLPGFAGRSATRAKIAAALNVSEDFLRRISNQQVLTAPAGSGKCATGNAAKATAKAETLKSRHGSDLYRKRFGRRHSRAVMQ